MNNDNKLVYPLNGYEMLKLNPDSKLITYDQLNKINDIDEIFKDTKKLIILYILHSPNSGHWICLTRNKDGTYIYFDSYGKDIDAHLDVLTPYERKLYNEQQDRLKFLLKNKNVYYNNILLQGKKTKVCGMYVTHFLHSYPITIQKYINNLIDKNINNTDKFVADYVLELLQK